MPLGSIIGAGIGVVGSLLGADRAADAAEGAAESSNALQRYIYDQTRRDQEPYRMVGTGALNQLAGLYGLPQFNANDPGTETFQFQEQQAIDGELQRQVADRAGDSAFGGLAARLAERGGFNYEQGFVDDVTRDVRINPRRYGLTPDRNVGADPATGRKPVTFDGQGNVIPSGAPQSATVGPDGQVSVGHSGGVQPQDQYAAFRNSPDYEFALQEGQNALQASLNAQGLNLSGRGIRETQRYGQGLASQQFNNYANRLASIAGIGQTANSALLSAGQNYAANAGSALMAAGDARASGYLTQANVLNQGINGILEALEGG